jgi:hypothetical protein
VDSRGPAERARRAREGMTITRRLAPIRAPTLMNGPVTMLLIKDAAATRQNAVHSLGKPFQLSELLGVFRRLWADKPGCDKEGIPVDDRPGINCACPAPPDG